MLADMLIGGVLGMVAVPALIRPTVELWRDRRQVWIPCDSIPEANLLVGRVYAYTNLPPLTKVEMDPHSKLTLCVRVPKTMLVAESMEASIKKLKEPLNV